MLVRVGVPAPGVSLFLWHQYHPNPGEGLFVARKDYRALDRSHGFALGEEKGKAS